MQRGYVFDLDGTIYLGNQLINGAEEAIRHIKDRGDKVIYLSNNPLYSRTDFQKKLKHFNIDVTIDEIYNSNYILASHLKQRMRSGEKAWVIGEWPLYEELQSQQIEITHNPLLADVVIVSWDRDFTYKKLHQAYQAWERGAVFIATNPDRTCPTETGPIPDCGAIIGAIEGATGAKIEEVAGKPSAIAAEVIQEALNLPASACFMVGDRLETDILMANTSKWNSVLVLTGVTTKKSSREPSYYTHHNFG